MEALPEELQLHILAHVSPGDLGLRCCLVSSQWRRLTYDDALWRDHLERAYPAWREILCDMGVNIPATPVRERFRLLSPHDPVEKRDGCCEHDVTKGALCSCCTCRRYHSGQQWPTLPGPVGLSWHREDFLARTYDAQASTVWSLVRTWLDTRALDDPHRDETNLDALERQGWVDAPTYSNDTSRVAWTAEAHKRFRPPLLDRLHGAGVTVQYTDARLYNVVALDHPGLCSDSAIERYGHVIAMCGRRMHPEDELVQQLAASGTQHDAAREILRELVRSGWLDFLDYNGRRYVRWSIDAMHRF